MDRILLVEDDQALALGIEFTLTEQKYAVQRAATARAAKELFDQKNFDLIILDINLPDDNGYEVCRYIREKSDVAIIFLTACADEVNIVLGLDLGGDDYITKPFRVKELLSRIKAVTRRKAKFLLGGRVMRSGELAVDTGKALVRKRDLEVALTAQEYRLLLIFLDHPHMVLKREQILTKLFNGVETYFEENTLSVYIKRIREKIEDDSSDPQYIVTQRGLGYKWNQDVQKE